MSKTPKFEIGDIVRYELSPFMRPRWIVNRDYGGFGVWEEATVVSIQYCTIAVQGKSGLSVWPLEGAPEYDESQWQRPGFLTVTRRVTPTADKRCVCGAHAVYGKDCKHHSSWCDLT